MKESLWALCGVLLVALCAVADEPKTDPFGDAATGIVFPETLGGLSRGSVERYAKHKDPGLGMSVRYRGTGVTRADVYVYDWNRKEIGSGIDAPAVRDHFKEVQGHVEKVASMGLYKDLERTDDGTVEMETPTGKRSLLSATFMYRQVKGPQVHFEGLNVSHLLMTGYKGKFVKIRFTYPQESEAAGKKALQEFLTDFGALIPVAMTAKEKAPEKPPEKAPEKPDEPAEAKPAPEL